MVVLHTCKNEENPVKNEGARMLTRLYFVVCVFFPYAQGQLTPKSAVEFCRNSNSSKNEEDPIKNEGARVLTRFSPL